MMIKSLRLMEAYHNEDICKHFMNGKDINTDSNKLHTKNIDHKHSN